MKYPDLNNILSMPMKELISLSNDVRREGTGSHIDVCGIVNAKSGSCSEDCKFCAQSSRYPSSSPEYSLISKEKIVAAANDTKNNGAERFGIVTSGNRLTTDEVSILADAITEIRDNIGIEVCGSLGALSKDSLTELNDSGLTRYHHNIETSERFYPNIVSTHSYSDRIDTIKAAKELGIEVCSGGIIGLGESWQDRMDMAILLKELEVDSVPLNFLVPIKGTPMENAEKISHIDALRTIALFRLVIKDKSIKIAAGRESIFKGLEESMYDAGANGMLIGGYLTIAGRSVEDDQALISGVQDKWNKE